MMLREAFHIFDADNDGFITIGEIQEVLESLGYKYNHEEVEEMVSEVDLEGDGAIDFEEFKNLMEQTDGTELEKNENDLRQAFCLVVGDSNGYISECELCELRDNLGMEMDDDELHQMIHSIDDGGDDFMNYTIHKINVH